MTQLERSITLATIAWLADNPDYAPGWMWMDFSRYWPYDGRWFNGRLAATPRAILPAAVYACLTGGVRWTRYGVDAWYPDVGRETGYRERMRYSVQRAVIAATEALANGSTI
jgi:hypothetical protein